MKSETILVLLKNELNKMVKAKKEFLETHENYEDCKEMFFNQAEWGALMGQVQVSCEELERVLTMIEEMEQSSVDEKDLFGTLALRDYSDFYLIDRGYKND